VSVIRTVKEEPCSQCGRLTNAYDMLMGRLCPECIAKRAITFARNIRNLYGIDEPEELDPYYYKLATLPLIDHSNDIDAHLHSITNYRDPKRIPIILKRLENIWRRFPDLRLGQLIENVFPNRGIAGHSESAYYLEDEEFIERIEKFYSNIKSEKEIDHTKLIRDEENVQNR